MRNFAKHLCVAGEAVGDCTKAVESRPKEAQGYVQRGYLHFFEGDYDLAAIDFDMATSLRVVLSLSSSGVATDEFTMRDGTC